MAATSTRQMWFHSSDDGSHPNVERGLIAASQGIFMPGAPVYLSQSGTWKLSDTSDGTGDVWHGFIIGLENKSSTWPITAELSANTAIKVARINVKHKYCIYCENNGTDSAVAQTNVGNEYGITVSATASEVGYCSLDLNNSNDTVTVVDIMSNLEPSKFSTSDNPGVAVVRFLNAVIEAERA